VAPGGQGSDDPLYRRRWWFAANSVTVAAFAVICGVGLRQRWNWALFCWGVAIFALQIVLLELSVTLVKRFVALPDSALERRARRRPIIALVMVQLGVMVGSAAAGFDSVAIDIAALVWTLICQAIAFIRSVRIIRQRGRTLPLSS
jgi:hypothetical protein